MPSTQQKYKNFTFQVLKSRHIGWSITLELLGIGHCSTLGQRSMYFRNDELPHQNMESLATNLPLSSHSPSLCL